MGNNNEILHSEMDCMEVLKESAPKLDTSSEVGLPQDDSFLYDDGNLALQALDEIREDESYSNYSVFFDNIHEIRPCYRNSSPIRKDKGYELVVADDDFISFWNYNYKHVYVKERNDIGFKKPFVDFMAIYYLYLYQKDNMKELYRRAKRRDNLFPEQYYAITVEVSFSDEKIDEDYTAPLPNARSIQSDKFFLTSICQYDGGYAVACFYDDGHDKRPYTVYYGKAYVGNHDELTEEIRQEYEIESFISEGKDLITDPNYN